MGYPEKKLLLFFWPVILLFLAPPQVVAQTGDLVFYVSPHGKTSNPGTFERPFATPQEARNAIRKARVKNPGRRYTVYFREGTYVFKEPLELNASDSGSLEFPVKYAAYRRENVVFHGGARLDPTSFSPVQDENILSRLRPEVRGNVLEINLIKAGISDFGQMRQHGFGPVPGPAPLELFINDKWQTLARYPNEGKLNIGRVNDPGSIPRQGDFSNRGAAFGYEYEGPERWTKATDIWLHGWFSFGYNDDHLRVEKIDTAGKIIRTAQPHLYGVVTNTYPDTSKWSDMAGLSLRGYYVYNLPEEIDRPGEWYLDRASGKLYLYPPPDFSNAKVEVSMLEAPLLQLRNTAFISVEGITFTTSRGMGIYLENAHHIAIEACTFNKLGTVAVSAGQPLQHTAQRYALDGSPVLDQWDSELFHHIAVRHCRIHDTGAGGIILTGGDRRTLTPSGNEISRCEFYRVDLRNHTYAAALKLFGAGNSVDHCHFHDLRHMAIWYRGNDHRISHNLFERICTYADDMGAICTGRDPASRGISILNNHFRDILPFDDESQVGAVFLDDGVGGTEVARNFFERTGSKGDKELFGAVFIHGGHENNVHHNVFLDCEMAVGNNYWPDKRWKAYLEGPIIRERLLREVDITGPVFLEKYPGLKNYFSDYGPRLNRVAENVLIGSNMPINGKLELYFNHLETRPNLEKALKRVGYVEEPVGVGSEH